MIGHRWLRILGVALLCATIPPSFEGVATAKERPKSDGLTDTKVHPPKGVVLDVEFDGRRLAKPFVLRLAKSPVVAWGGIDNDAGTALVPGELWFTVATGRRFVYYHLTDDPNPAKGPTSYGGYTVKAKAIATVRAFNLGAGDTVPVIGNDTDGFFVTTNELFLNSALFDNREVRSISTGEQLASGVLVHVFDTVHSYAMPNPGSAGLQIVASDGSVLDETRYVDAATSASSDCVAAAESARDLVQSAGTATRDRIMLLPSMWVGGTSVLLLQPIGVLTAQQVAIFNRNVQHAADRVVDDVTSPLYSSVVEAGCGMLDDGNDIDDLSLLEVDLPSVEDVSFTKTTAKCVKKGRQWTGEVAGDDGDGGVVVHGQDEEVCNEWVFVVVEADQ